MTDTAPLTVRDVMTAPAVVVTREITYAEIAHRFLSSDLGGMPVVDDAGRLLGVVTEADLLFRQAYGPDSSSGEATLRSTGWERKTAAVTVGDLMTRNPVSADVDDRLDVVAQRLLENALSRLPVIREGQVIGIVSRHDVLRRYARPDYVIAADIERAMDSAKGDLHGSAMTSVSDGDVVLTGFAEDTDDIRLMERVAAGIDGAVSIDNQLVVRPDRTEP